MFCCCAKKAVVLYEFAIHLAWRGQDPSWMMLMDEVITADVEDEVTGKEVPSFMASYHE